MMLSTPPFYNGKEPKGTKVTTVKAFGGKKKLESRV